jgi:hypothetical protein
MTGENLSLPGEINVYLHHFLSEFSELFVWCIPTSSLSLGPNLKPSFTWLSTCLSVGRAHMVSN